MTTNFIEFHALHTVPPSNINRDDTGRPKTAIYGGVQRARTSSQAWKAAIRKRFGDEHDPSELSIRTKDCLSVLRERVAERDPSLVEHDRIGDRLLAVILSAVGAKNDARKKVRDRLRNPEKAAKDDEEARKKGEEPEVGPGFLTFISSAQYDALADVAVEALSSDDLVEWLGDSKNKKALSGAIQNHAAMDLALFGRMMSENRDISVDAATSVAHALGVDAAEIEPDYYTGMDDVRKDADEAGAGMLGSVEFSSSTLYRYAAIDVRQLLKNLNGDIATAKKAVQAFASAFVLTVPSGKQTSFAAHTLPEVVLVLGRDNQPVSLAQAFHNPVRPTDDGEVLTQATTALANELTDLTEQFGMTPKVTLFTRSSRAPEVLDSAGERVPLPALVEKASALVGE